MSDPQPLSSEAAELHELLGAHYVPKTTLASEFRDYSDASKDEVVARVLRTFSPAPSGALLARLLYIRTADNVRPMRTLFVGNLRSEDSAARKFSLLGLRELGHESLTDLALLMMRDSEDVVVAAAVDILIPVARQDANLSAFLRAFHAANRGDPACHLSLSLLEANGLASATP